MTEKEKEAKKALNALYLEVPEEVARDVQVKVLDWVEEIKEKGRG